MIGQHTEPPRAARRLLTPLLFSVLVFLGLAAVAGTAHAQQEDAEQVIRGRVFNELEEDGERVREPVADVRVVVSTEGGEEIAEAVTDADGAYVIPLEEPGTYVVSIDEESLPEGVGIEEGANSFTKTVAPGGSQTQAFFLGEDLRDVRGKLSQLPQTIANGLKLAMIIAITSIGLSLIFGTTGLSNFSHGEMVTLGAIFAWLFNREWGLQLIFAAILAVAVSALLGLVFETGIWRPLRHRKTSLTSMMIVSIGLALSIRYIILFFFGARTESYAQYAVQDASTRISVWEVSLLPRSLTIMALSLLVIIAVALFLLKARFGKAIRAVSDNPDLAASSGIDADRVILIVWMLGGALAGLGGIFYGLEFGVKWDMGFTLLLLMFAAITLGGLGNPFGALLGSLVIGVFVELWTWVVPNANDLKTVGALVALIAVLLVRPQGLLGSRERIG
jgi:neutral amino acid transport system permease protein